MKKEFVSKKAIRRSKKGSKIRRLTLEQRYTKKNLWSTPIELFEQYNMEFGFTLDACAIPENAKCQKFFSPETDGLIQDWTGNVVWLNAPYSGGELYYWVRKSYEESQKGTTVIALLPSTTDVAWFHEFVLNKAEIRFLKRRVKFIDPFGNSKGSPMFGSLIAIWRGEKPQEESVLKNEAS